MNANPRVHPRPWRHTADRVIQGVRYREITGGVWTVLAPCRGFEQNDFLVAFRDIFGEEKVGWPKMSTADAKRDAERASDFLAACWVVSHRLELAKMGEFWITSSSGARSRLWGAISQAIKVQRVPPDVEGRGFDPFRWTCWRDYQDDESHVDEYPDTEAFLEGVFGREYRLAATNPAVMEVAAGLWPEWRDGFQSCLQTAVTLAGVE